MRCDLLILVCMLIVGTGWLGFSNGVIIRNKSLDVTFPPSELEDDPEYADPRDYDIDVLPDAYIVEFVNNSHFAQWRKDQGPETLLVRRGSLLVLLRSRRQVYKTSRYVITPVLPINGSKNYNDTECLKWEDFAVLLRSGITPHQKGDLTEAKTCNMHQGLECVTEEDESTGEVTQRCACNLVYGPKAIFTEYTRNGIDYKHCFIPAESGYASECQRKPWWNFGFPLPFGDPAGTNAETAAQVDAYNSPNGRTEVVHYVKWNSIRPTCILNAACREKRTYLGQRCQCLKTHKRRIDTPKGYCAEAAKPRGSRLIYILIIGMTAVLFLS